MPPRKRTPKRPSGQNPRRRPSPSAPSGGGQWTVDDVQRLVANPFYAITVHPMLSTPHEPMYSREQWIAMNTRLITDLGPERYLRVLLEVLEGDYVTGSDAENAFGYMDRPEDEDGDGDEGEDR